MTHKEAIDRIKDMHSHMLFAEDREALETLIPELAESEDEKIIKTLQEYVKNRNWMLNGPSQGEVLEWLEKQKQQKPKTMVRIPKFRVGDIIQHIPLEKWDSTKKITSIDEHGYNFNCSHLGNTLSSGAIGFAFEDEYELVEQKPTEWSERYIADVFEKVGLAKIVREQGNNELTNAVQSAMLELSKVGNAEWSEEDDEIRANRIYLKGYNDAVRNLKPAWSEEDEKKLTAVISLMRTSRAVDPFYDKMCLESWLKSIRPQWRPSEEQMDVMKEAVMYFGDSWISSKHKILLGLYEQLKKLGVKEEPEYYQHFDPDC